MEAIIRTENKCLFEALLNFLKSLNITVETKEKRQVRALNKSEKQIAAMKKLRGSGNGKLMSALLVERIKDKSR